MNPDEDHLDESVLFILEGAKLKPKIGIILGSGLGFLALRLARKQEFRTESIPHYPLSTVSGHEGKLVLGMLGNVPVVVFQGRVHYYETGSINSVLYPVRVVEKLGVSILIVTNAAGGINREFEPGDLMVITDQINLTGIKIPGNQLSGPQRRPLYNSDLLSKAIECGVKNKVRVKRGIYAGVMGPSYETVSEVEMVHRAGGDAIGMSTVLEVELASALGLRTLGISCITNKSTGITDSKLTHQEVTDIAGKAKEDFSRLLAALVKELA